MAKQGITDTDKGLADIFKEVEKLKSMCVKVGIPRDGTKNDDGVEIAKYAEWNEFGVEKKDKSGWYIPPRPFFRTTLDTKREEIALTEEKLYSLVLNGKVEARVALQKLGDAVADMMRNTIKDGNWTPNSDITIHGTKAVVVGKETKISKKTGKTYKKTIKEQFIKGKKSTKPLIDTGTMLGAIKAVIVDKRETGE
jgi:hypothetical protein